MNERLLGKEKKVEGGTLCNKKQRKTEDISYWEKRNVK
jgi:hypothetical protein